MAFFGVTLEEISEVQKHPNADRLDILKLSGMDFQFIAPRGKHTAGEKIIYFPIDSILPLAVIKAIGLEGKLSGANKDRVKTVKLRDEISQGVVATLTELNGVLAEEFLEKINTLTSEVLTEALGVVKYDPEPNIIQNGSLCPLPAGTSIYDIEGADRYPEAIEMLLEQPVQVTEKVEGQNFSCTISPEGNIFVNMRKHTIIPNDGETKHYFWEVAKKAGLLDQMKFIQATVWNLQHKFKNTNVSVYGELCGPKVQDNIYQFKSNELFVFDIRTDHGFLDVQDLMNICSAFKLTPVPELAFGVTLKKWLDGKTIKQASTSNSVINTKTLREGIVIKPLTEQNWAKGRLIIKQRSPEYLAKSKT